MYSTTGDDFFTYELNPDLKDRPGIDLDGAGGWVVAEVIRLGYRREHHARFDGYVIGKYGGGRSKPSGLNASARSTSGLPSTGSSATSPTTRPRPPVGGTRRHPRSPGPQTDISRQVDPTVIEFAPASYDPRAWVPGYDWAATADKTDALWVADDTDLPTVAVNEAEYDGRPFIVMSGTYDWNNAGDDDYSKRTRGMRTHLYSHLVTTTDLPTALTELEGRDLLGQAISNSPQTSDGYVGEFPYGHHHGEMLHVIDHESSQPLSVPTTPAAWDILGEYGYARGTTKPSPSTYLLPSSSAPGAASSTGTAVTAGPNHTGQLVAVLRHTVNAGQNELLIAAAWLETGSLTKRSP